MSFQTCSSTQCMFAPGFEIYFATCKRPLACNTLLPCLHPVELQFPQFVTHQSFLFYHKQLLLSWEQLWKGWDREGWKGNCTANSFSVTSPSFLPSQRCCVYGVDLDCVTPDKVFVFCGSAKKSCWKRAAGCHLLIKEQHCAPFCMLFFQSWPGRKHAMI